MSNKLFASNLDGYLVEGAKAKGYLKCSGKGFGDGATSGPVKGYTDVRGKSNDGWYEGNKSNVGTTVKR